MSPSGTQWPWARKEHSPVCCSSAHEGRKWRPSLLAIQRTGWEQHRMTTLTLQTLLYPLLSHVQALVLVCIHLHVINMDTRHPFIYWMQEAMPTMGPADVGKTHATLTSMSEVSKQCFWSNVKTLPPHTNWLWFAGTQNWCLACCSSTPARMKTYLWSSLDKWEIPTEREMHVLVRPIKSI